MSDWKPEEQEIVREAWSPLQAYADYVTMYPGHPRNYESVRRQWYREHEKIEEAS